MFRDPVVGGRDLDKLLQPRRRLLLRPGLRPAPEDPSGRQGRHQDRQRLPGGGAQVVAGRGVLARTFEELVTRKFTN